MSVKIESKLFKRLIELQEEEQVILKRLIKNESKVFKYKTKTFKIEFQIDRLILIEIKNNK